MTVDLVVPAQTTALTKVRPVPLWPRGLKEAPPRQGRSGSFHPGPPGPTSASRGASGLLA